MNSFVVKYTEIALKGKNRPWFLSRLVRNLRRATGDVGVTLVRANTGRIEVVLGPGASPVAVAERIGRVFGIANYSFAGRASMDIDQIATAINEDLGERAPRTFRASARRADK